MTLRLNLGCGDRRIDGYLNVDLREDVADVICDVRHLTLWEDGAVDEIVAHDLLEHFPETQTIDILTEWRRVLAEHGKLSVKVPNLKLLCVELLAKPGLRHLLTRNVYGGHRWGPEGAWDAHHWGWFPEDLERVLDACRFKVTGNDCELNMRIEAVAV